MESSILLNIYKYNDLFTKKGQDAFILPFRSCLPADALWVF